MQLPAQRLYASAAQFALLCFFVAPIETFAGEVTQPADIAFSGSGTTATSVP